MAFHPLLDWRLARDMLEIGTTGNLDLLAWQATEKDLAKSLAEEFGGAALRLTDSAWGVKALDRMFIVCHPFEATRELDRGPRLAEATAEAELLMVDPEEGPYYLDTFNLIRRMGLAVTRALA